MEPGNQTHAKRGEPTPWWEWLVIMLAIFSFWPLILGCRHFAYWIVLGFFGLLMLVILVRKIARLRRLRDKVEQEKRDLPPGGLPPYAP